MALKCGHPESDLVLVYRETIIRKRCRGCHRETCRAWRAKHRDRVNAYRRRWWEKNKEYVREANRRRRLAVRAKNESART